MNTSKFFPSKIIQVFALFLLSLLLVFPFFIIFKIDKITTSDLLKTLWFTLVNSVFIMLTWVINFKRKQKLELHFKISRFHCLYLMLFAILFFQVGINIPLNHVFENLWSDSTKLINSENIYIALGAITIGPFFEEIIFRGIILRGLLTRYSARISILLSSLMFGLIHFRPEQIWGAILLGLFFGYIYLKTKSVGTVILLHSFANLCILIFKNYQVKILTNSLTYAFSFAIMVSSSIAILLIVRRLEAFLKIEISNK